MRAVFIRRFLCGIPEISVADIYCQRKLECLLRKYYGADAVPPLASKAPASGTLRIGVSGIAAPDRGVFPCGAEIWQKALNQGGVYRSGRGKLAVIAALLWARVVSETV